MGVATGPLKNGLLVRTDSTSLGAGQEVPAEVQASIRPRREQGQGGECRGDGRGVKQKVEHYDGCGSRPNGRRIEQAPSPSRRSGYAGGQIGGDGALHRPAESHAVVLLLGKHGEERVGERQLLRITSRRR